MMAVIKEGTAGLEGLCFRKSYFSLKLYVKCNGFITISKIFVGLIYKMVSIIRYNPHTKKSFEVPENMDPEIPISQNV